VCECVVCVCGVCVCVRVLGNSRVTRPKPELSYRVTEEMNIYKNCFWIMVKEYENVWPRHPNITEHNLLLRHRMSTYPSFFQHIGFLAVRRKPLPLPLPFSINFASNCKLVFRNEQ